MTERRRLQSSPEAGEATLEQRIAAALGNGSLAAADIEQLLAAIEDGINAGAELVKAERARSLDPTTPASEAEQAAQRSSSADLKCCRYATALVRLREQLAEALHADKVAAWNQAADRADSKIADATITLFRCYREFAEPLLAALQEAEAANRAAGDCNGRVPDGVMRRVDKVDLLPLQSLVLPDPEHPGTNLWPRYLALGAIYANSMTFGRDPRYSADWHKAQEARTEALREQQQQRADHYQQLSREQEERINKEERERFAQSQRRV